MRTSIESILDAAVEGPGRAGIESQLAGRADEVLPALAARLRADVAIDVLERYEEILKAVLRQRLTSPSDGAAIRALAGFQRDLGFLLKYKSYAIKASSPLGYSVFLQNPGEGFSFQRHITHKTEIFYILDVLPGAYVYICEFDEWQRMYRRHSFLAWLAGEPHAQYERFRYRPHPGDVIVMDRLNVVHTVVGCVLAEFATVSTDMVDRLHDQNEGKTVPPHFCRRYAEANIKAISWPSSSHRVDILAAGHSRTPVPSHEVTGGSRTTFGDRVVTAAFTRIEAGKDSAIGTDPERAACLHIVEGSGQLILGDAAEVRRASPPTMPAEKGDLFLVPPGAHYGFVNDGRVSSIVAEHRIPVSVAFI